MTKYRAIVTVDIELPTLDTFRKWYAEDGQPWDEGDARTQLNYFSANPEAHIRACVHDPETGISLVGVISVVEVQDV